MRQGYPGGFSEVLIVGIGLIGGSLAAALKRLEPAPAVFGIDTDRHALRVALDTGILDEASTPEEAEDLGWLGGEGPGMAVLATPASIAEEWMHRLGETGYAGIVTDVASTKAGLVSAAASLGPDARYVGGHPMAGSERSGIGAAREDLFDGAYYVLTPTADTDTDAYRRLHALLVAIGARPIAVDAFEHDTAVAVVSHVPHIAAAALTNLAADHAEGDSDVLRLAAGGFKDTTRIAAGSPDLWAGISLDNAEALVEGLTELAASLLHYAELTRSGDVQAMKSWLSEAADVRKRLPAQWVPATEALTELALPVSDCPGVISEVTAAVRRAGCNIEDIGIDHLSEDRAVLRLVLTDEGDLDALAEDLRSRGYQPETRPLEGEGDRS